MILIADIHGCFKTLMRLLDRCPQEDVRNMDIVFLGDLIDRGPRSKEVVEFAMSNGIKTLCGNHEDLALAHHNVKPNCGEYYGYQVWYPNGGDLTLASYESERLPDNVLEWMAKLPIYHVDPRYHNLFLSHTGHWKSADKGDRFNALWARERNFRNDGMYRVFGHTPAKKAIVRKNYAMIDTGAAYSSHGYGVLSAMLWPSKEIIEQEFDET